MRERALLLGEAQGLVGVLTASDDAQAIPELPVVLLLSSGIVHRSGPHRLYVRVARALAERGFIVVRFDFSGIGDSEARADNLPFIESAVRETQEVIDEVSSLTGRQRFILMGVCSGGTIAFRTACCDSRVAGTIMINAQGYLEGNDDELRARIRHRTLARHYRRITLSSSFRLKNVRKALTGRVPYRDIARKALQLPRELMATRTSNDAPALERQIADLRTLRKRNVRLCLIHSEGDEGLDYLRLALGDKLDPWRAEGIFELDLIEGANHTCTLRWSQEHLLRLVLKIGDGYLPDGERRPA